MRLSRSTWRKLAVLVTAVAGFVLLYEAQMFDSRSALWQSMAPNGVPRPGAQLPFSATAYCRGTTTASGVGVRTGIAAADPALLPVGSVVNIATGDLKYSGVYTVMDTGPKVQGRILDLYVWNCDEAIEFGRQEVQVTVLRLGWDPRASSPGLVDRLFRRRESARRPPSPAPPPPAGIAPEETRATDAPTGLDAPSATAPEPPDGEASTASP